MIHVETLSVGPLGTNCYLAWADGSKSCAVIDPGASPAAILEKARALGLSIDSILLTHGHFDHVGAVKAIYEATRCPVYLHQKELSLPSVLTAGELCYTDFYEPGETVRAGGIDFSVLYTPGHTPGSVCLYNSEVLFSGDTLFAGSCGRVDFPGGNGEQMRCSLATLCVLPFSGKVYPGHGSATTLDQERRTNPYFRGGV